MALTAPTTSAAQVDVAHRAFQEARETSPAMRATWLRAIADALEAQADSLVPLAHRETHLPEARLRGELNRTAFQLRLLGAEVESGEHLEATIDHADPEWGMGPRPDLRRVNVPLGVVAVFGASNFPFAFSVIGGDSASALAAGCAVVHKIHEGHPELGEVTGRLVTESLEAAGAPRGLFSTVTGRAAGEALIDHSHVKAVGFTGSTEAGRTLFDRAMKRPEPIPFFGELGSINPVFVTERAWAARAEDIMTGFAASFTLGMGQFCTKPGLLFTPHLADADVLTWVRSATGPSAPLLTESIVQGYHQALKRARSTRGVEELVTGEQGSAPAPVLLATTTATLRENPELMRREIFGPASIVVQYDSEDELPEIAETLDGQLTASVHLEAGEDVSRLLTVLADKAGRTICNGWPTGVTVSYAQHHGGPYPATTAVANTSVGTGSVRRFLRPVAHQDFPDAVLPPALRDANPWGVPQRVDGTWSRE